MPRAGSSTTTEVGPKLLESGCRQGALLDAPARMLWLARPSNESDWNTEEDTVANARLVVISQDCDIFAAVKAEPRIEAMAARWTSNASEIHTARKGNSARLFLLRERTGEGLVADARLRVQLDKTALLGASFEPAFHDDRARTRFANWVAGRYNRPAVANELVEAVQKPIVSAVADLVKRKAPLVGILDSVAELRFAAAPAQRPWTVHLVVMVDEGDDLNVEEEAELAGWLESVLVKPDGPIEAIAPLFRTERNISLHDYLHTTKLQLDHFSPEEDAPQAA